jgi:hypothetical protein
MGRIQRGSCRQAEGVTQPDEDGKGEEGGDLSYEKGMMVPFKKYRQKDFPTL